MDGNAVANSAKQYINGYLYRRRKFLSAAFAESA